ncbi:Hypothetical protein R9X50_00240800 [Acrodontium crateriforme]|uniref:Peroxin 20 n=1 Tax=Acrodontium crateriforme TaxID=150365 RepID=A0AAQ3M478_9PEZI|nr:Hypothetical protein R9X50_00240800 [Acrodontium crateriforme]
MSDALCGPSNALQQFKQQTSHDRTLQQDRLATRNAPSQGFRSADPRAGLLDPEFEAFQAGLPPSELPQYQQFQHQQPVFAAPSQQPAWASDFQRMQISPQPLAQHHNVQQMHAGPATADWAQGFREQMAHSAPRAQQSASSPQAFQQRARFGMPGFQSHFAQPGYAPEVQQSKGKEPAVEAFDEAAFERAFDQAREDLMEEADQVAKGVSTMDQFDVQMHSNHDMQDPGLPRQTAINEILQEPAMDMEQEVNQDVLHGETEQHQETQNNDDDALAATAQELLNKIEHNQTDKFKNSQFLGLMRKLRDREMKVEGDKMVETATAGSSSNTGQALNSISHSPMSRFNNSEQRPSPLGVPGVGTQQAMREGIPAHEQDLDTGRHIDGRDGQEVVDLLNERERVLYADELHTEDSDSEFMTTSPYYQR